MLVFFTCLHIFPPRPMESSRCTHPPAFTSPFSSSPVVINSNLSLPSIFTNLFIFFAPCLLYWFLAQVKGRPLLYLRSVGRSGYKKMLRFMMVVWSGRICIYSLKNKMHYVLICAAC